MGNFITLTPHPVTKHFTKNGHISQPLWTVVDVSNFDILDLELGVLFLSSDMTIAFSIETSMQNQTDSAGSAPDDWIMAGEFPHSIIAQSNQIPSPQWQKIHISAASSKGFLRFVRWRVDANAAGTVTFFIRGIARRWGR